jgi:hypothetical protein
MLLGASIGAQIGATAIKYIRGYGIRLLFAITIIFAGFCIAVEQLYKITKIPIYQTFAGIVLLGTALLMTLIIIAKMMLESKKKK